MFQQSKYYCRMWELSKQCVLKLSLVAIIVNVRFPRLDNKLEIRVNTDENSNSNEANNFH